MSTALAGLPYRVTRQVVDGASAPFLNRAVCRGNSVPRGTDRNLSLPSPHLALYSHAEHRLGFRPRPPGKRLALRLRADAPAGHASTSPETYGGRSLSGDTTRAFAEQRTAALAHAKAYTVGELWKLRLAEPEKEGFDNYVYSKQWVSMEPAFGHRRPTP